MGAPKSVHPETPARQVVWNQRGSERLPKASGIIGNAPAQAAAHLSGTDKVSGSQTEASCSVIRAQDALPRMWEMAAPLLFHMKVTSLCRN